MTDESSEIVVVSTRIDPSVLAQLVGRFEDMVKYVVDTEPKVVAVGGELHADAEEVLLESGNRQSDVWGLTITRFAVLMTASSSHHSSTFGRLRVTGAW